MTGQPRKPPGPHEAASLSVFDRSAAGLCWVVSEQRVCLSTAGSGVGAGVQEKQIPGKVHVRMEFSLSPPPPPEAAPLGTAHQTPWAPGGQTGQGHNVWECLAAEPRGQGST